MITRTCYFRPEDFNLTEEDLMSEREFDQLRIEVDPKQQALRIDRFLVDRIPNLSRNRIQPFERRTFCCKWSST